MTDHPSEPEAAAGAGGGNDDSALARRLAQALHRHWVRQQVEAGWRPAPVFNEAAREDPALFDFDRLPSSRQRHWLSRAAETLSIAADAGLRLLPSASEGDAALLEEELLKSLRFRELVELFQSQRDAWRGAPANFLSLGEALLQRSEPVSAYEVFQAGIDAAEHAPVCDVALRRRLLQRAAQALADAGALHESERILAGLCGAGERDPETLGLWAKVHKRVGIDSGDPHALAMALRLYSEGFESATADGDVDGAIYNGVNAASMARLAGQAEKSSQLLERVQHLCRAKSAPSYWDFASLGECSLLAGEMAAAIAYYESAVAVAPLRDRLSMWQQAILLCEHLDLAAEPLLAVFEPPSILVFCGHRLDSERAVVERFPPESEASVRREIRCRIEALRPGFGFCSAMCGSDILFIEEMIDYGAEVHVFLPFPASRFAEEYVAYAGSDWLTRFQAALDRVDSVTTVGEWDIGLNDRTHEFCGLYALGAALLQQRNSRCDLRGLTVWDGSEDPASGTHSVIAAWRGYGLDWDAVSPRGAAERTPAPIDQAGPDDQRFTFLPMMFADVRGYSRLSGLQLYIFAQRFMSACADVLRSHEEGIYSTRSQGDSLFIVFRELSSAVSAARALRDMISSTDWEGSGLPADLTARFALDCGPCYAYGDPVTGRREICGAHVIRAARLEPVTPPGHIYASESFAALCAVNRVEAEFEAAGRIILPKSYGQMRVYHLC
jgi:class 3 adenylate cyclase/tetratricopeptide (TPR) repeat protein